MPMKNPVHPGRIVREDCLEPLKLSVTEAAKVLGVKNRTEAIHLALREVVALKRFKDLMTKNAGKLKFAGLGE